MDRNEGMRAYVDVCLKLAWKSLISIKPRVRWGRVDCVCVCACVCGYRYCRAKRGFSSCPDRRARDTRGRQDCKCEPRINVPYTLPLSLSLSLTHAPTPSLCLTRSQRSSDYRYVYIIAVERATPGPINEFFSSLWHLYAFSANSLLGRARLHVTEHNARPAS